MHRPVCVKCQVDLRPELNGARVLDHASYGPYQLWDSDKFRCPSCGVEIITGFGDRPISMHHEEDFEKLVKDAKDRGVLVNSWEFKND